MKKRLFLLLLTLAAMGAVWAQEDAAEVEPTAQKTPHFSFGVVAGYDQNYHIADMSYMTDYKYDKFAKGSTYGLQLAYHPLRWLALRADVVMIQKNYHRDHVFQYYNLRYSLPTTTTNDYLNVPVVAEMSFGKTVRLNLFGGGYYGHWMKSHREGTTYSFSSDRLIDFDEDVEFDEVRDNRDDMGFVWGAGLSVFFLNHIELGAEVKWYYGVQDIQKPYSQSLRPRYNTTMAIQGGLSYWF